MKKIILAILSVCIISIANGQVGQYEYIQLNRSGWPHISFIENGQSVARIQGSGGNFNITSTNGGTNHLSISTSGGNVGVGINPSNSRFHIYASSQRLLKLENNLDFDAGVEFKTNLANFKIGAGIGSNSNSFVIYDLAASSARLSINSSGNIGIGTSNPISKLEVNGDISLSRVHKIKFLENVNGGDRAYIRSTSGEGGDFNSLVFAIGGGNEAMIIKANDGKVGIGTLNPDSKLTVAGNIHAQEVKVSIDAGADFVLNESYQLRTLEETEQFITRNNHLPEIPSEKEMVENGLHIGEMNIKLLQKIEELTLYMIDVNKRVSQLENDNSKLIETNEQLIKEIDSLR